MSEHLFAGRSYVGRTRGPLHCAVSSRKPDGRLRYKALCGVWITTDGQTFLPHEPGFCAACSRAFEKRLVQMLRKEQKETNP